mmetsp:Transcript_1191/g.2208  ORF Transcript_1191/g.2208 Transcript_1191/m.2208 type:complete len:196 (-) Transcript_1191:448-1035(-)|eukprot:CAMPEP_0182450636 /NCGR_PEP_ID=MMETSP1172-20130603/42668_1 /TAXON_ID=708627 /ORGANISM="Timspurckia oligopyrenoides, Strain CCMP3278" /LENGTH=195 /DNA_ID=CAMNT_0024648319 /DNA_START=6 /DNA_END=593 /DNA_ORIENTATION=+
MVEKTIGGPNNGGKREVERPRSAKFYPGEDVAPKSAPMVHKAPKLRASLTPGTVVILLASRFRGRRVIFLKQLESGTLLITGPYAANGVPLRRIDPRYVIATQTKIDISAVDVSKFDDKYFKKAKSSSKKSEAEFFNAEEGESKPKKVLPESFKADQKAVDGALVAALKKDPLLKCYLKAKFSLTKGQAPHEMVF